MSITIRFESEEERDKWLDQIYPSRRCTSTPGLFVTPTAYIHVFWLKTEITLRSKSSKKGPKNGSK